MISNQSINNQLYSFINFVELDKLEVELIHNERNHIDVRFSMFDPSPITFEQHCKFLNLLKFDRSKIYFLVKRKNEYVGVYSLVNIAGSEAQSGFYLLENARIKNIAIEFLYYTISFVFSKLSISTINGFALKENKVANRINTLFKFKDSTPSKSTDLYNYSELYKHTWESEVVNNINILKLMSHTEKLFQNEI